MKPKLKALSIVFFSLYMWNCATSNDPSNKMDSTQEKSLLDQAMEKANSPEGKKLIETAKEKAQDPATQEKLKSMMNKDKK